MRKLFFMMLAVCTLASCSKDDGGGDGDKAIQIESGQTSQVVFADNSSGGGVTFKTTGAWTSLITESTPTRAGTPDWVTIDPASGNAAGSYTINITLGNNYTGSKRTASITINCGGDKITITITQDGKTENNTLPKRRLIKSIDYSSTSGESILGLYSFEYDSDDRVTKMIYDENVFTVEYVSDTQIKYKEVYQQEDYRIEENGTFTLQDNRVTRAQINCNGTGVGYDGKSEFTADDNFYYQNGYLYSQDDEDDRTEYYYWTAENITQIKYKENSESATDNILTAVYGNKLRLENIDLGYILEGVEEDYHFVGNFVYGNAFGWFGKNNKNHLIKTTTNYWGNNTHTFTYQFDVSGYTKQISFQSDSPDSKDNIDTYIINYK